MRRLGLQREFKTQEGVEKKTPHDVFTLSEFILEKLEYIKIQKGIRSHAKEIHHIYGLEPMHVYIKGIEVLEKVAKLKKLEGFKASQVPFSPTIQITPSEVYKLTIRLDDELDLIYKLDSFKTKSIKKQDKNKTPSDLYNVLHKVNSLVSLILKDSSYEN